jgi:cell division protein FtsL
MRNAGRRDGGGQPVVRLRIMLIGLCVLVASIAGPLVLVWKQSYINQMSIRLESRADTLKALSREITSLNLERGRLSSTARIERVARSRGLEYPASGRVEVLEVAMPRQRREGGGAGFFARARQYLSGESW